MSSGTAGPLRPVEPPLRSVDDLALRHGLVDGGRGLAALLELVAVDPTAPTSVRDRGAILRDHLADSLAALELDQVAGATEVADIGSGGGFPGLPLALALPHARVSLIEANGRKCEFIARAIAACGVPNARAVHARAESWGEGLGRCDLVTARALAPLPVLAEYAAPLLRCGGVLVAWRGRRDREDEVAGALAGAELGLEPGPVVEVRPYPGALHRHLHVLTKTRDTPGRFPRRPGMALKRPLAPPSDRSRR
ncbi:MAG: 16S rRNA (guanine(527)-N(7))-methyltransferase RsmG [Solirubrobacteraceae bacterium]